MNLWARAFRAAGRAHHRRENSPMLTRSPGGMSLRCVLKAFVVRYGLPRSAEPRHHGRVINPSRAHLRNRARFYVRQPLDQDRRDFRILCGQPPLTMSCRAMRGMVRKVEPMRRRKRVRLSSIPLSAGPKASRGQPLCARDIVPSAERRPRRSSRRFCDHKSDRTKPEPISRRLVQVVQTTA